ncbi:MAG: hypothetical protein R3F30_03800 [Planctomycetota bacterium]
MSFKKSFLITFTFNMAILALDKGAGLIMAWILRDQPDQKGILDILGQMPYVLMVLANLGLASSTVYFTRRGEVPISVAGRTTGTVALVWGSVVALLGLAGIGLWGLLDPSRVLPGWNLLLPLFLATPLLLVISYRNSLLLVLDRIRSYNLVHLVPSLCYLPILLVFYLGLRQSTAVSVVWARVLPVALLAGWLIWYLRREVPPGPQLDRPFLKRALGFGWKANLNSVLTHLNHRLDIILLLPILFVPAAAAVEALAGGPAPAGAEQWSTAEARATLVLKEVAFYSMAVTLAELVWHFPEAMRDLMFAKVAGLDREEASRFTPVVARNSMVVTTVAAVLIWLLHEPFLSLVLGDSWEIWHAKVTGSLAVLLPGAICYTLAKVLQADLAGRGHIGTCLFLVATVFVTMVVGDVLFVPAGGAVAAAAVSTVSYGIASGLTLLVYLRETRTRIDQVLVPRWSDLGHYSALLTDLLGRRSRA